MLWNIITTIRSRRACKVRLPDFAAINSSELKLVFLVSWVRIKHAEAFHFMLYIFGTNSQKNWGLFVNLFISYALMFLSCLSCSSGLSYIPIVSSFSPEKEKLRHSNLKPLMCIILTVMFWCPLRNWGINSVHIGIICIFSQERIFFHPQLCLCVRAAMSKPHKSTSHYCLVNPPFHTCCYLSLTNQSWHSSPPTPTSLHSLLYCICLVHHLLLWMVDPRHSNFLSSISLCSSQLSFCFTSIRYRSSSLQHIVSSC